MSWRGAGRDTGRSASAMNQRSHGQHHRITAYPTATRCCAAASHHRYYGHQHRRRRRRQGPHKHKPYEVTRRQRHLRPAYYDANKPTLRPLDSASIHGASVRPRLWQPVGAFTPTSRDRHSRPRRLHVTAGPFNTAECHRTPLDICGISSGLPDDVPVCMGVKVRATAGPRPPRGGPGRMTIITKMEDQEDSSGLQDSSPRQAGRITHRPTSSWAATLQPSQQPTTHAACMLTPRPLRCAPRAPRTWQRGMRMHACTCIGFVNLPPALLTTLRVGIWLQSL